MVDKSVLFAFLFIPIVFDEHVGRLDPLLSARKDSVQQCVYVRSDNTLSMLTKKCVSFTLIRVRVPFSCVAWNHLIEETIQLWSTWQWKRTWVDLSFIYLSIFYHLYSCGLLGCGREPVLIKIYSFSFLSLGGGG